MNLNSLLTGASLCILASEGKQVTAVAAPVGGEIGEALESVRNAVVDLLLVGVGLVVGFADTFGDNLRVAFRWQVYLESAHCMPAAYLRKSSTRQVCSFPS